MSFGSRLAEERKRLGLKQADFADRVGTDVPKQSLYENDRRELRAEYLARLVDHEIDVVYTLSGRRSGAESGPIPLRPALEVWGAVQSLPEPGIAIVGVGKRDVSFDAGLPRPIRVYREGGGEIGAETLSVLELWDQHARLAGPDGALRIGDLVGFGISHPCATFDRWRALYTADDDDSITGFVGTIF